MFKKNFEVKFPVVQHSWASPSVCVLDLYWWHISQPHPTVYFPALRNCNYSYLFTEELSRHCFHSGIKNRHEALCSRKKTQHYSHHCWAAWSHRSFPNPPSREISEFHHQHTLFLSNAQSEISDLQRNTKAEHYANTFCNCSPLVTGGTSALYCQALLMTPNWWPVPSTPK